MAGCRLGQHGGLGFQLRSLSRQRLQLGRGSRRPVEGGLGIRLDLDGSVETGASVETGGAQGRQLAVEAGDGVADLGGLGLRHGRVAERFQAGALLHELGDLTLGAGGDTFLGGRSSGDRVEDVVGRRQAGLLDDAEAGRAHLVEGALGCTDAGVEAAALVAEAVQLGLAAAHGVVKLLAGLDPVQLDLQTLKLLLHGRDALGHILVHGRPFRDFRHKIADIVLAGAGAEVEEARNTRADAADLQELGRHAQLLLHCLQVLADVALGGQLQRLVGAVEEHEAAGLTLAAPADVALDFGLAAHECDDLATGAAGDDDGRAVVALGRKRRERVHEGRLTGAVATE